MYLTAKRYLHQFKLEDKLIAEKIKEIFGTNLTCNEVCFNVGYWRKANAIHAWFVSNVQDGVDNCKEYYVEVEQLKQLLKLVEQVLTNHSEAEALLPSQAGFFFGNTEYDESYFIDLEDTKKILEKVIKLEENYDIYYSSSW